MPLVSITRARVRALWFLPPFALRTRAVIDQVRHADGFLGGSLLPDRRWTFWTMTLWEGDDAMRAFVTAGPHGATMSKFSEWCDEASVVRWVRPESGLPPWSVADGRMRREGRASKVRRPSRDHRSMTFAAPRLGPGGPITPARRQPAGAR